MSSDMTKINTLELQMKHTNEKIDSLEKSSKEGWNKLNSKLDEICLKMDRDFVKKEIYAIETDYMKTQIGFVKGVIFTGAGVIALYVLNSILQII